MSSDSGISYACFRPNARLIVLIEADVGSRGRAGDEEGAGGVGSGGVDSAGGSGSRNSSSPSSAMKSISSDGLPVA
jgi:hypothetical protein